MSGDKWIKQQASADEGQGHGGEEEKNSRDCGSRSVGLGN